MNKTASYDEDTYAWSQEQAAALRRLAETRRDLPNELDLVHVAEEIEDVGRSEARTVESFLEPLLIHLLKTASAPNAAPVRHWRGEIKLQQRALVREFRNSMRQIVNLREAWDAAKLRADAALDQHGETLIADLPQECPFSLDDLLAADFDPDQHLKRLILSLPAPGETDGPQASQRLRRL